MVLKKCRFVKECSRFDSTKIKCNNLGKNRSNKRPDQCYRDMQEIESIKQGLIILNRNAVVHQGSISVMEQRLKELTDA